MLGTTPRSSTSDEKVVLMKDHIISRVWAREVLDSRGDPTVEAEVEVSGHTVRAIAPSGASTGTFEALELRDDGDRYRGKGVLKAVENVRGRIAPVLVGMDATDLRSLDQAMIDLDGTETKSELGGNAITAVSLACARAGAMAAGVPLYRHLGDGKVLPVPMFNVINGGKHAGGGLRIQEFMVIPGGAKSLTECMRMASDVYWSLRDVLKTRYGASAINVGDEGGFAPPLNSTEEAFYAMLDAIEGAGYTPGSDFALAIDAASSEFFVNGEYEVDGQLLTPGEMVDFYVDLMDTYPLISIEDPFMEDAFDDMAELTRKVGDRVQLVGDDLFVTNVKRLSRGIETGAANALLLKVNQIGTISESFDAARMAFDAGYNVVVSHRSGETEDTTIADIAVALGCGQIKTGAPARSERTSKYNRLMRIEESFEGATFPGFSAFSRD